MGTSTTSIIANRNDFPLPSQIFVCLEILLVISHFSSFPDLFHFSKPFKYFSVFFQISRLHCGSDVTFASTVRFRTGRIRQIVFSGPKRTDNWIQYKASF